MAHTRELAPKRKSRLQAIMEAEEVTDELLSAQVQEWSETLDLSSDWTTRSAYDSCLILVTSDELDHLYAKFVRPSDPTFPPVLWDVPTPRKLTEALTRFLLYKLKHTRGHHSSGLVRVKSFRDWARRVCFISAYNIIGFGGKGKNRPASVLRGELIDRSDSQWQAVVVRFVESTAVKYGLPTKRAKGSFWGPSELALVVRGVESKMLTYPASAESFLQVKVAGQLGLTCGVRTGAMAYSGPKHSGSERRFLMEDKVSFIQTERGHYAMEVEFVVLKGLSKAGQDESEFTPRLPPVTKVGNLQVEAQSSIIPLLVYRRSLYEVVNGARNVFSSIDEFLESESQHFFVLERDLPLLRKMLRKGGTHSNEALSANSLNDKHHAIATFIRLPRSRLYNYRKYHGAVTRAAFGPDGQRVVLNHRVTGDVGRTHYSRGVGDLPAAQTVLDENPTAEARIRDAGLREREKDSPAVRAMLDLRRCGVVENFDGITATPEEIAEAAATDARYQDLASSLDNLKASRALTDVNPGLDEQIKDATRQLAAHKSRLGTVIKRRKHRQSQKSVVYSGGTVQEFAEAKAAVDKLRSSLPLIMTATTARSDDFSSLWPTEIEPVVDGEAPLIERMEEDETLDAMQWVVTDLETATSERDSVQHPMSNWGFDGTTSGGVENEDDESDDEEDEDDDLPLVFWNDHDEAPDSSSPEELAALRASYMRATYRLLTVNQSRESITNFMVTNGYCPICPMDEVGVQALVNCGFP